jgi:para-nitrobenzyl esterase
MLIGSVSEEGNRMSSRPTEAEWLATLTKSYGQAKAAAIVAVLKKADPHKSIRTLSYMCSGAGLNGLGMRNNVTRMATMKHEQQGAPVFTYYFTWLSPMLEDAGVAHRRARLLLRQYRAMRPRDGQRPGGAGGGQTNGDRLGELRAYG